MVTVSGSVTAASFSSSGNVTAAGLAVDSTTLVVDSANNRVGVGTATPQNALDVVGDINGTGKVTAGSLAVDSSTLVVDSTNNRVGVGVTTPARALEVYGDTYISRAGYGIILTSPDGTHCIRVTASNTGTLAATAVTCP
jgi:hypothetical protein